MVGPTVKSLRTVKGDILVLATRATILSEIYQRAFLSVNINAIGLPLPDLVTLIEHGGSRDAMFAMIHQALISQKEQRYSHIILGCTHFPLVREVFEEVLVSLRIHAELIDPAEAVAQAVVTRFDTAGKGSMRLLTSAKSLIFESFVCTLFPEETHVVEVF
jgi:glutamate racemase